MGLMAVEERASNEVDGSNRLACIFPTLTDGYILDHSKCNDGRKTHKIDLDAFNNAKAIQNLIEDHKISPEAVIVTAWTLTIARYIGADNVSFYVFLNNASMWTALVCDLATYESKTQLQLLRQAHDNLYSARPRDTPLKEITVQELREKFSSQFSNTAIVFENDSSNVDASIIDQVQKDVCGLIY
jgi:hypothetical protein